MADTMQFDLVSPERRLASMQVTSVQIPGADGDMTAMEGHAPTITTLRPGVPDFPFLPAWSAAACLPLSAPGADPSGPKIR